MSDKLISEELEELLTQFGMTVEDFRCFYCEHNNDCDISFDPYELDCDTILTDKTRPNRN